MVCEHAEAYDGLKSYVALRRLGMERTWKVMQVSLRTPQYAKKDWTIGKFLLSFIKERLLSVTLLTVCRYLQLVPACKWHQSSSLFSCMSMYMLFKAPLFLLSPFDINLVVEQEYEKSASFTMGDPVDRRKHLVKMWWCRLIEKCCNNELAGSLASYVRFNDRKL